MFFFIHLFFSDGAVKGANLLWNIRIRKVTKWIGYTGYLLWMLKIFVIIIWRFECLHVYLINDVKYGPYTWDHSATINTLELTTEPPIHSFFMNAECYDGFVPFDLYEFIWNVTYAHIVCWSISQNQMRKTHRRGHIHIWCDFGTWWFPKSIFIILLSFLICRNQKMKSFQNSKFTHSRNLNPYEDICI